MTERILSEPTVCNEGELYKIITVRGRSFPIYYGYYEERDRYNSLAEPIPIYPDFIKEPQYASPFVTKMQDACERFKNLSGKHLTSQECAECEYYVDGEELIGTCSCPHNREDDTGRQKGQPPEITHRGKKT